MISETPSRTTSIEMPPGDSGAEESRLPSSPQVLSDQNEEPHPDYPVTLVLAALGAW